jgi:hypothetical protein
LAVKCLSFNDKYLINNQHMSSGPVDASFVDEANVGVDPAQTPYREGAPLFSFEELQLRQRRSFRAA